MNKWAVKSGGVQVSVGRHRVWWGLHGWVVNANGMVWVGLVSWVELPSLLEWGQVRWVGS